MVAYLEKAHVVEEVAHEANDLRSSDELVTNALVHDQVQVSLSVARFLRVTTEQSNLIVACMKLPGSKFKLSYLVLETVKEGWQLMEAR